MTINYEEMEAIANNLASAAGEYEAEIKKLYSKINELKNAWDGEDNAVYVRKIDGYKENLQSLGKVLNDYSSFIRSSINLLKETQNEIANAASGL